ncbi:MAG: AtpZ/AtpI family protein [Acetobacteraceae bacterium]|nr:AtpZ/AtpI family protein [Acetobacteraceae bacterium]
MTEEHGGSSFEDRLRAARERRGLNPKPPAPSPSGGGEPSALSIGFRVAVELVSAMLVACAIGWGIDRLAGTRPLFLILFVPLGGAAGVLNVWRVFAPRQEGERRK